jgi:hypothetical protein
MNRFASLAPEFLADEKRVMLHNQGRSLAGSRRSASFFQAVTKVSWVRSSLWLRLPVAQYASEEIKV